MALWSDKERSGQALGLDSMNVKKFLINFIWIVYGTPSFGQAKKGCGKQYLINDMNKNRDIVFFLSTGYVQQIT